jgi:hypothetical protein
MNNELEMIWKDVAMDIYFADIQMRENPCPALFWLIYELLIR